MCRRRQPMYGLAASVQLFALIRVRPARSSSGLFHVLAQEFHHVPTGPA